MLPPTASCSITKARSDYELKPSLPGRSRVASIEYGLQQKLFLGNRDAIRDRRGPRGARVHREGIRVCWADGRFPPTEIDSLIGDASKARGKLGWRHKTSFETLVADMAEADLIAIRDERERRNRHG
jgi:GDP-D-mannose dehydratase